ncbi:SAM-dependent methyltransferase [Staphylococcus gallinarum]|uniref:SAM-dependent methyltransferase n=1 Tax=Staphylococcus gallinarum TaxID=1293 RepID=A0A3A0W6J5_STAGA|nr:SAM-dependent methyltransferase [Staphylococcus gallinarum]
MSVNTDQLSLDRIIFIGRTFDEYVKMFNLNMDTLKHKSILDCPAGACAFAAKAKSLAINIKSCDIAYYFDKQSLYNKGLQDIKHAMESMEEAKVLYNWTHFNNIQEVKAARYQALEDCYSDMLINESDYLAVTLPDLPYENNNFDLLLSAHFLFMYAEHLDYEFHLACLNEMLRVTKEEIRIFPIVDLRGKQYQYLHEILTYINDLGHETELIKVDYEFQKNAHTMLRIKLNNNSADDR